MKTSQSILIIALISAFSLMMGCGEIDIHKALPDCLISQVEAIGTPDENLALYEIWQWEFDGIYFFYVRLGCCDQFNYLYDMDCNEFCAPDGGFSGGGDGKCPTFTDDVVKTLIWEREE